MQIFSRKSIFRPASTAQEGVLRKYLNGGKQLRETQKLKYIFGLSSKQLKKYFKMAVKKTGNTGLFMCQFLESRLDNVVYRLGFAPTRPQHANWFAINM